MDAALLATAKGVEQAHVVAMSKPACGRARVLVEGGTLIP